MGAGTQLRASWALPARLEAELLVLREPVVHPIGVVEGSHIANDLGADRVNQVTQWVPLAGLLVITLEVRDEHLLVVCERGCDFDLAAYVFYAVPLCAGEDVIGHDRARVPCETRTAGWLGRDPERIAVVGHMCSDVEGSVLVHVGQGLEQPEGVVASALRV